MNDFLNNIIGYGSSGYNSFGNSLSKFASNINGYKGATAQAMGAQAPTVTPVSSSPAAAPTTPVTNNPAVQTPAAQTFIQSQKSPTPSVPGYTLTASNAPGAQQVKDANGNLYYGVSNQSQGGTNTSSNQNNPTASNNTTTNTSSSNPTSGNAQGAYSKYLASQISDSLSSKTAANQRLADIQSQQDAQSQGARELQDKIIHTPGGLLGGAQLASTVAGRNAANTAADLAVQEGAAARSADVANTNYSDLTSQNKPINVGNQLYQLQQDGTYKSVAGTPEKLDTSTIEVNGKKELINNQTGEVIKNLGSATAPATTDSTAYVAGTNPVVDSWVSNINSGKAKLSDITGNPSLKSLVSQGLSQSGGSASDILDTTQQSLKELNDMVSGNEGTLGNGFTSAVGAKGLSSLFGALGKPIAGTPAANFDAKLNQVKNDVILPNLTLLHGLGRVTDREFQALTSAVTSLSTDLDENAFKTELKNITDRINEKAIQAKSSSSSSSSSKGSTYLGIQLPN